MKSPDAAGSEVIKLDYWNYWAKTMAGTGQKPDFHPAPCHLLDTAAVCQALLRHDPLIRTRLANWLRLEDARLTVLCGFVACLHDVGKFSPLFQALEPGLLLHLQNRECHKHPQSHQWPGYLAWHCRLFPAWLKNGWLGLDGNNRACKKALGRILEHPVFSHHGRPVARPEGAVGDEDRQWTGAYSQPRDEKALLDFAADAALLLAPQHTALAGWEPGARQSGWAPASWLLAGLVTASDWIASNRDFFPFYVGPPDLATTGGAAGTWLNKP